MESHATQVVESARASLDALVRASKAPGMQYLVVDQAHNVFLRTTTHDERRADRGDARLAHRVRRRHPLLLQGRRRRRISQHDARVP